MIPSSSCAVMFACVCYFDIAVDEDKQIGDLVEENRLAIQAVRGLSPAQLDDTLSIAVEWIRLRDSAVNRRFGRRSQYFLGYLTGRLRVMPPQWWMRTLRTGTVSPEGIVGFNCDGIDRHWRVSKSGWKYSGLNDVDSVAEKLFLVNADHKVVLNKNITTQPTSGPKEWDNGSDGAIAAAIRDGVCAVAFKCPTSDSGGPNQVYCIDIGTGDILWTRQLVSESALPFAVGGPVGGSYTEVDIDDDRVIVWYAHDFSLCYEVFDKKDGRRVARFSSWQLEGIRLAPNK